MFTIQLLLLTSLSSYRDLIVWQMSMDLARMSHKLEKRCEARQNEIRDGSVLAHVTKRVEAITPPRALVVLRFLLNNPQNTLCIRPKLTTRSHPNSYTRSAETG